MIELQNDSLVFSFPEVHPSATLKLHFQRTLRIPDDDSTYPLPPGLGQFPLRHVDDFGGQVPAQWIEHGGVMFPMYQSEAMWINFSSMHDGERGQRHQEDRLSVSFHVRIQQDSGFSGIQVEPHGLLVF